MPRAPPHSKLTPANNSGRCSSADDDDQDDAAAAAASASPRDLRKVRGTYAKLERQGTARAGLDGDELELARRELLAGEAGAAGSGVDDRPPGRANIAAAAAPRPLSRASTARAATAADKPPTTPSSRGRRARRDEKKRARRARRKQRRGTGAGSATDPSTGSSSVTETDDSDSSEGGRRGRRRPPSSARGAKLSRSSSNPGIVPPASRGYKEYVRRGAAEADAAQARRQRDEEERRRHEARINMIYAQESEPAVGDSVARQREEAEATDEEGGDGEQWYCTDGHLNVYGWLMVLFTYASGVVVCGVFEIYGIFLTVTVFDGDLAAAGLGVVAGCFLVWVASNLARGMSPLHLCIYWSFVKRGWVSYYTTCAALVGGSCGVVIAQSFWIAPRDDPELTEAEVLDKEDEGRMTAVLVACTWPLVLCLLAGVAPTGG